MSRKTKGKGSRKPRPSPMKKGKGKYVSRMAARRPSKTAKPVVSTRDVPPSAKRAKKTPPAPKPRTLNTDERLAALESCALNAGWHLPHAAGHITDPNANT